MAVQNTAATVPVCLIAGEDEYGVKQRGRQLYQQWSAEIGGMDHEMIDAAALNSGDALNSIRRLREALQTLPFFGGGKVVWWQNCNFLSESRTANSSAVAAAMTDLAAEIKVFRWDTVRLLVTAGDVDKRKTFYKTLDKIGRVELFAGWSSDDKEWTHQAESAARSQIENLGLTIDDGACAQLVLSVGPNPRFLATEIEKLALFCLDRAAITAKDVEAIVTKQKTSRAFALADALGSRQLPRLLKTLDAELWHIKLDSAASEIGMLYGLISKVRVMLLLKELIDQGLLRNTSSYPQFKSMLERIPAESTPEDKKFNPLAMHPFLLFNSLPHAANYSKQELINGMEVLLQCNLKLVGSSLDAALVLQQALMSIVQGEVSFAA